MRILAFDCAGAQCAAAILSDGGAGGHAHCVAERGHAQLLIPMLVELLAEAGLELQRYRPFCRHHRPRLLHRHPRRAGGSARAGAGYRQADRRRHRVRSDGRRRRRSIPRLLVAIDSRRAELFVQLFDAAGLPLTEPAMLAPEAVADWAGPGALALTGNAAALIAPHLAGRVDNPPDGWATQVDPAIVARLAADRPAGTPPAPFYLRAPDAVPAKIR
jgi:tRNA threonylcarbamoyladenosine biosynthesis protein TsaB